MSDPLNHSLVGQPRPAEDVDADEPSAGRVGNGMALRLNLPTVVYYCREGAKNCRARTRQAAGLVN